MLEQGAMGESYSQLERCELRIGLEPRFSIPKSHVIPIIVTARFWASYAMSANH